ncbi:MAG: cation:proton antiporter [Lysobacterales bacterium]
MSSAQWFLLVGGLLLLIGLTVSPLKRSAVTSPIIYLAVGVLLGPSALNLFHFNPLKQSALLEILTEVAVLISLFSAGIKMPAPFRLERWRTPILLATVSMSLTVAMVAAFVWYALGLPLGAGILLGAIVAPTDPVLASDVQLRHTTDNDQLRFTLTCEAGMNDGSAFPFVMLGMGLLGLHGLGEFGSIWLLRDVLWATVAGIGVGVLAGGALAHLGWKLRRGPSRHELMDDFLGLGLMAAVYGVSLMISAWGFLAVFFSAVALRQTESRLARKALLAVPAEAASASAPNPALDVEMPALETVSEGSLVFKEHLGRLSEVLLVILIGGTLFVDSWSWRAVGFALFLFLIARPVSVYAGLIGSGSSWRVRGMTGWFGVRGIGSLYYLMYAIQHGLPQALALELIQITLIVVTLSILLHGISVKPLMARFWRRKQEPAGGPHL